MFQKYFLVNKKERKKTERRKENTKKKERKKERKKEKKERKKFLFTPMEQCPDINPTSAASHIL